MKIVNLYHVSYNDQIVKCEPQQKYSEANFVTFDSYHHVVLAKKAQA